MSNETLAAELARLNDALDRMPASEGWSRRYGVPVIVAVLCALPTGIFGAYVGMSVKQAELARDVAGLRDADDESRRERGDLRSQVQSIVFTMSETKEKLAGVAVQVEAHTRELDGVDRRLSRVEGARRGAMAPAPEAPVLLIDLSEPPPTPPAIAAVWGPWP